MCHYIFFFKHFTDLVTWYTESDRNVDIGCREILLSFYVNKTSHHEKIPIYLTRLNPTFI